MALKLRVCWLIPDIVLNFISLHNINVLRDFHNYFCAEATVNTISSGMNTVENPVMPVRGKPMATRTASQWGLLQPSVGHVV